jgi:hypothetical protein
MHVARTHERAVRSLCDRTGAPVAHVRELFVRELARLELHATVRSYLPVLTAANVRAMLPRATGFPAQQRPLARQVALAVWEDTGGEHSARFR